MIIPKNPLQSYFKSYVSNFQLGRLKSCHLTSSGLFLQSLCFRGKKKNFFICCRCHSCLLHWSYLRIWHLVIPAWNHESVKMKVAQSCLTLCDPMDSTVHGILQARTLEWVAFPFSRGFSQPKDWTQVSGLAGRSFTSWATREITSPW